jgi:type IV pilus assembly protein PilA
MNEQRRTSKVTIIVSILILLVIVAIVVPLWRHHEISGRVDTALKATDAAKVAVMEAATVHGGLSNVKAGELGYSPSASSTPYVSRIDIADGGLITLATKGTGATPDVQLLLTPKQADGNASAPINWDCNILVGDADSVPVNCRKTAAATHH